MPGFLGKIIGKGAADSVTAVGNVLDKLFTSKDEKLTHEEIRMRLLQQPDLAQNEITKMEAQHRSIFVAGWRPYIGWVCGTALAYNFILRDLIAWGIQLSGKAIVAPPELAVGPLTTVLTGMLGLAGMRTYEKLKGKTK